MIDIEISDIIDQFLKILNKSKVPLSLSDGIILMKIPKLFKVEELKFIEDKIDAFGLAKRISGRRDNSTIIGECEYLINEKGRYLVDNNLSTSTIFSFEDLFDVVGWDDYFEFKIDKRVEQADYYIDIIISANVLGLEKNTIKMYFKDWFLKTQNFDLQFEKGDFAIEDGDLKIIPDFDKEHIADFLIWFENRKQDFLDFLKTKGVPMKIINAGVNFTIFQNINIPFAAKCMFSR